MTKKERLIVLNVHLTALDMGRRKHFYKKKFTGFLSDTNVYIETIRSLIETVSDEANRDKNYIYWSRLILFSLYSPFTRYYSKSSGVLI